MIYLVYGQTPSGRSYFTGIAKASYEAAQDWADIKNDDNKGNEDAPYYYVICQNL